METANSWLPKLLITLGDAAGIGPELLVRGWPSAQLHDVATLAVVGSADRIFDEISRQNAPIALVDAGDDDGFRSSSSTMPCIDVRDPMVSGLAVGKAHAACGLAAYRYLKVAVDLTLAGRADGIVTLPLNKEGLAAAGLPYPGHTEILAEECGVRDFGMMLYRRGLGVLHATLHMALRDVFAHLNFERVLTTISLLDEMMRRLGFARPRLAAAALNPHASDNGLFGDEERRFIAPAVAAARECGIDVIGPVPADTLFARAKEGEFDGIAAMYHDQGHIALKSLGWREAVNITVGLPIVRTSVAHGTAYDIVGRGVADPASLIEAASVASNLARSARQHPGKEAETCKAAP